MWPSVRPSGQKRLKRRTVWGQVLGPMGFCANTEYSVPQIRLLGAIFGARVVGVAGLERRGADSRWVYGLLGGAPHQTAAGHRQRRRQPTTKQPNNQTTTTNTLWQRRCGRRCRRRRRRCVSRVIHRPSACRNTPSLPGSALISLLLLCGSRALLQAAGFQLSSQPARGTHELTAKEGSE